MYPDKYVTQNLSGQGLHHWFGLSETNNLVLAEGFDKGVTGTDNVQQRPPITDIGRRNHLHYISSWGEATGPTASDT